MNEKEFIDRLAQLRLQKGVSAREMSLDLGMSENYINMVENEKLSPSQNVFFSICEYFRITPQEFYNVETGNPALLNELIEYASKLNDTSLSHLIEIIKGMVE